MKNEFSDEMEELSQSEKYLPCNMKIMKIRGHSQSLHKRAMHSGTLLYPLHWRARILRDCWVSKASLDYSKTDEKPYVKPGDDF